MHISVSLVVTPELARRSYRACYPGASVERWLTAGIFLVGGLAMLITALQNSRPNLLGLVGGCAFLALGIVRVVIPARRAARLAHSAAGSAPITIVLSDTGYTVTDPDRTVTRAWSTFTSVSPVRGFWVLKTGLESPITFPTGLLDAEQTDVFQAVVRKKGLLRGQAPTQRK